MTAEDQGWEIDSGDDWYDDMPDQHVKEEPDCYACNDSGFIWPEQKRCRACQPTWVQHWWWRLTWRIKDHFAYRRRRRKYPGLYDDEPPF